jgi:hypothetical protein
MGCPLEVGDLASHRVDLDAMIPREDLAIVDDKYQSPNLIKDFPISHLIKDAAVLQILRKPNFQRETNHWTPRQIVTFIESFLDGEIIPSLIFWKSPHFIFVIDGGHRISALRAWMEDDYGDNHVSRAFYKTDIPKRQNDIAIATRKLVKKRIGTYADLRNVLNSPKGVDEKKYRQAQTAFTRALDLQWILPPTDAKAAETSFFKINSQGTPLDEVETMLIKNRAKPIAIAARAIVRAGSGHKYWSAFQPEVALQIEDATAEIYDHIFKPELDEPVRTLELPIGGSVSPVEALALLVEFLAVSGTRSKPRKAIDEYDDDSTGAATVSVLKNAYEVLDRISGNGRGSLGLHPAVYFYNENGRYNRFLFLGMVNVIEEKLRNNNSSWFKSFTAARSKLETFLLVNKSVIGAILVNLSKATRVEKMRDLIEYLVKELRDTDKEVSVEEVIGALKLSGPIIDVKAIQSSSEISDNTRSAVFLKAAIPRAILCPICAGVLEPKKSATYDHVKPIREKGSGDVHNVQMVHPYCNTAIKN